MQRKTLAHCVYLDVETTGLQPDDEVVAIAIVDAAGGVLLDSLVRPQHHVEWGLAQEIHGISPAAVAGAPTLAELATPIQAAIYNRHVVIYNAAFDCEFLGDLLDSAAETSCCMLAWAQHNGEWSHYWGDYRWHTLTSAAADVGVTWLATPHSALADALACRAVWHYLHDPQLRAGIEALQAWRAQQEEAAWQGQRRQRELQARLEHFIDYWWLGRGGPPHWARRSADPGTELAVLFTGTTLRGLDLLTTYATCYRRKAEIPAQLKPAGWFHSSAWYQRELQATAAFVGRRQAYPLHPVSEKERLDVKFALRLAPVVATPDAGLATRTELRGLGYSHGQIQALTPVAELYNPVGHFWYPVYQVPRLERAL